MKHVKVDYHFVYDRVSNILLDVWFISTEDQMTDGFTKALSQGWLQEFQRTLSCE
jgi:hypothetical protein